MTTATGPSPATIRSLPGPRHRSVWARRLAVFPAVLLLVFGGSPAVVADTHAYRCWTPIAASPPEALAPVRCRMDGAGLVDRDAPPGPAFPGVGEDLVGECWFDLDHWAGWEVLAVGADGSAQLARDLDGVRGGVSIAAGIVRRCASEPALTFNEKLVLEFVRLHLGTVVIPEVDPERGIVGLPAYLDLVVPGSAVHEARNWETGELMRAEIVVSSLEAHWGVDAEPFRWQPDSLRVDGYPHGQVRWTYLSDGHFEVTVAYRWVVRWNIDGGPWRPMELPETLVELAYEVDQVVGRVVR